MSIDRQIDQVCPHIVYDEALFFDSDRQTIRPLRPISSAISVGVRLNREIEVPSIGVAVAAQSSGTKEGPFTILEGVNDVVSLQVDQGTVQTATLAAGTRIPVEQLAGRLNVAFGGVLFSVRNNRLAFRSTSEGRGSSVFVKAASTFAATVGITTNREYRGQQVVPGWTLVSDPNTLRDRPSRLIIFDEPLRSTTDFVEINYGTVRQECRRCGGTGVENDWRYGANGEMVVARDELLLLQELQKDFYTVAGSNPFHIWYGTTLLDLIGKKLSGGGFIQNIIVQNIYDAFTRWQSVKRQQEEKVGQRVTDKEFPFRLLSVDLQQSTKDPTVIFVSITVQNRSNEPIQLERGLKLPEPVDLLGSTASQGVIRQSLSNYAQVG